MIDEKKLIEVIKNVQEHMREANSEPVPVDVREIFTLFIEMVEKQPKVGEWIPCSERLPIEKGWYQCTCRDENILRGDGIVCNLYWYPKLGEFVDNIRYKTNGLKDIEKYFWTKYVVAWQPLPQPYKEGE